MAFTWPPRELGIGAPLNIAFASRRTRDRLAPWWMVAAFGVGATLLLVGVDLAAFGGETLRRLPGIGQPPSLANRLVITFAGPLVEELVLRVVVATAVAWLASKVLTFVVAEPRAAAQWTGVAVAAIVAGLWHGGEAESALRVVVLNVATNVVYGALYWWRGFELAYLTHVIVTATLLLVVPALR